MTGRTWGDAVNNLVSMRAAQFGGQTPAPMNAPPAAPLGYGVQPGANTGVVIGRLVLIFGPTGAVVGLFVYAPGTTPGPGNPPIASITGGTSDPYGNPVTPIIAAYGVNNQILAMQQIFGFARLIYYSGAASEAAAANLYNLVFNRSAANEQIGTFLTSAESTASPLDKVQLDLYGSPANAAGMATGFFEYDQSAGSPPALVQSAQGTSNNSTTTTATLGVNTTLGNTLIVTVQGDSTSGPDPVVTGITIGGAADHFASVTVASGAVTRTEIWYDPNIGTAATSVVVTTTAATGAKVNITVAEWSGLLNPTSADQVSTNPSGAAGTPYTSLTTPSLTTSGEIAVGIVATEQTGGTINAATGFTMFGQLSTGQAITRSGYMQIGSSLSGVAYAGTFATNPGGYSAAIATFKPAASATAVRLLPASWGATGFAIAMSPKVCAAQPGTSGGSLVAETWHNLPFAAGFTFGTVGPAYRFEVNGSAGGIRLRGNVQLTANQAAGTTFSTLPVGWRWTNVPQVFVTATNTAATLNTGSVIAQASGALQLGAAGVTGNVVWLDGIFIPAD